MSDFLLLMSAPFAACLVIAAIHVYLGVHILERGVIFVDLALAQIAALGATAAFLIGYELDSYTAYLFSLTFTFLGALIFALTRARRERIPQEAIIGIVYIVASAAGILAVDKAPHGAEHIKGLLVGSILWVTWPAVGEMALIYLLVGLLHWALRGRFLLLSFDPDGARRRGLPLRRWDFLFYTSFGFVITISVPIAGVLLVFCFLIVPAVCGALFSDRLRPRLAVGWAIGTAVSSRLTAFLPGVLSYTLDLPTGAAVVCTFGVAPLACVGVRWAVRSGSASPRPPGARPP